LLLAETHLARRESQQAEAAYLRDIEVTPEHIAALMLAGAIHERREVPVAVVARKDEALTRTDLLARCRAELAGYKGARHDHMDQRPNQST